MERDKVAALRRVAIVLSSLPEATAKRLLAALESDQQRAVRSAITGLDDVDPLERRRALDGFTRSISQQRSSLAGANDAAEIVLSSVALRRDDGHATSRSSSHAVNDTSSPFAFFGGVDDDAIAHYIKDEHPQTVAIILASILPAQAARLLGKLGVAMRTETMRRLARMETPTPEVIEDIAAQLKQKLVHAGSDHGGGLHSGSYPGHSAAGFDMATGRSQSAGQAALQAILAQMSHNSHGLAAVASSSGQPRGDAEYGNVNRSAAAGSGQGSHQESVSSNRNGRSGEPLQQSHDEIIGGGQWQQAEAFDPLLRRLPQGDLVRNSPANQRPDSLDRSSQGLPGSPSHAVSVTSTDEIHSQLVATSPDRLREALANVEGRQALLALCGLPSANAEAVLNVLPRRQARQIRQQIAALGMVELREIDRAKEAVAQWIGRSLSTDTTRGQSSQRVSATPALAAA